MRIRDGKIDLTLGPGVRKEGLEYARIRAHDQEVTKRFSLVTATTLAMAVVLGMVLTSESQYLVFIIAVPLVFGLGYIGVSWFTIQMFGGLKIEGGDSESDIDRQ